MDLAMAAKRKRFHHFATNLVSLGCTALSPSLDKRNNNLRVFLQ